MMARKRYETAFIPSPTTTLPASLYPDVDSLLLSIDAMALGDIERRRRPSQRHHRWRSKSMNPPPKPPRLSTGPSVSPSPAANAAAIDLQPRAPSTDTVNWSATDDKEQQGSSPNLRLNYRLSTHPFETIETDTGAGRHRNVSERGQRSRVPLSLSEPLRPKQFLMKSYASIQSSSGCSTSNSSPLPRADSQKLDRKGQRSNTILPPKRSALTLLKVNSASSLDSIDSGQCEDAKFVEKGPGTKRVPISKLLSPISDKSPLEPMTGTVTQKTVSEVTAELDEVNFRKQSLLSTAEQLKNLPWEMPKLKRKLALLADSGISLDTGRDNDLWPLTRDPKGHVTCAEEIPKVEPNIVSAEIPNRSGQVTLGKRQVLSDSPPTTQAPPPPPQCEDHTAAVPKPDRCKMKLDFGGDGSGRVKGQTEHVINVKVHLEGQDWFHGAITRIEAEEILRRTKAGSFLVRNCESSVFNRYSLSLKSSRGFIHVRIEPNPSSGHFSMGSEAAAFESVPSLILHFMSHRLPIKGAEHVLLKYPVMTNML